MGLFIFRTFCDRISVSNMETNEKATEKENEAPFSKEATEDDIDLENLPLEDLPL